MTYERFEDLPVWKAAIEFAVKVYELTSKEQFKAHGGLRDQLERAAVSISNNIAEGFERGTTQELLTFIYIARGSCGESRSVLCLIELLPPFRDLKSEISNLKSRSVSISRQLRGWANHCRTPKSSVNATSRIARVAPPKLRASEKSFWKSLEECRKSE